MTDTTVIPPAPIPPAPPSRETSPPLILARPVKLSSLPQHVPMVVAVFVCASFGYAIWALSKNEVPAANKELLDTLLGVLGTAFVAVVMYYFGSNSGSKVKDETISKLAQ